MPCVSAESNIPKTSKDLNQERLEEILSQDSKRFKIVEVKYCARKSEFNNENFQSDIGIINVKSSDGTSISIVIKETMNGASFLHRLTSSSQRPFFKECIWYQVSVHILAEAWPLIKDISPKCYYTYHNQNISLEKPWIWRNKSVRPQTMTSFEKSMILLENMTSEDKESEKYSQLDVSSSVLDAKVAISALRSVGHFHGIWWQFLNRKNPKFKYTKGFMPEDFEFHFTSNNTSTWWFEPFCKPYFNAYEQLLLNHLPECEGRDLASRVKHYFKGGKLINLLKRTMFDTLSEQSIFKTMAHGDCWRNNMLVRSSDGHVLLLDYQGQMIAHPGRDIWYFIYTISDREWRNKHLENCKKEYFTILSSYLDGHMKLDYDSFSKELEELRGIVLFASMCVEIVSRYPKEIDKHSTFLTGKEYEIIFENIKAPEKEDDHPSLKMIRKKLIDTARDMRDLNII